MDQVINFLKFAGSSPAIIGELKTLNTLDAVSELAAKYDFSFTPEQFLKATQETVDGMSEIERGVFLSLSSGPSTCPCTWMD